MNQQPPVKLRNLEFIQMDEHTYFGYRGFRAVYWIHRSPQWGDAWQAFTWEDRKPVERGKDQYRNDLFERLDAMEDR